MYFYIKSNNRLSYRKKKKKKKREICQSSYWRRNFGNEQKKFTENEIPQDSLKNKLQAVSSYF